MNVDFNEPMRAALARVRRRAPLHLHIGLDAVEAETLDGRAVERRVPLPVRWAKGFAEVGAATTDLPLAFALAVRPAQAFLRRLPRGKAGRAHVWARPAGSGARLVARPGAGTAWLAAPERLRVLEPIVRHVKGLRVYAQPDARGSSVWSADLGTARLVVTLSPAPTRGLSGEGGLLYDLADAGAGRDASVLERALDGWHRFGDREPAASDLPAKRAPRALRRLGADRRIAFDPVDRAWFRRELPFPRETLAAEPPRLRDARALVASGAVHHVGGAGVVVTSGETQYRVGLDPSRCTCRWWRDHPGDRGPCKHVLAATIAAAT